jgi:Resolvase, N terminal domain
MAEPAAAHLRRDAYIYVRQSTLAQTIRNTESLARQYDLAGRARELGWAEHQVVVVDDDLGRSGASAQGRKGFSDLVADVGLGKAGIVLSLECSRLARNNSDWHRLLGAPRGAVYSCGDGRAPPPGRRSGLVKLGAAVRREVA